jgi:hypothetical protein
VRRSRASWFAPSHATDQENPDQEGTLQAMREAVVPMSVSVHGVGQPAAVRCAAAGQDGAGRRSVGRWIWIWTTMLAQHAPAATCAGAGLSPAPTERAAAGRWNDPGVDDDRPAEHVLHDA